MHLPVNDAQLQQILSAAVLQAIGPDGRDTIMRSAVEHLLTPAPQYPSDRGRQLSPLVHAVNDAMRRVASTMAEEMINNDETLKQQVRDLMREAAEKVFTERREKVVEKMADAFQRAIES